MAKKTARSARAHAKTARQPSRKAKAGRFKRRNGSSARPATAQRQRTQLTPGPSGIDKLLEFFSDAGIEAQFGPDRHLQIDGRDLGPFTPLPYPDTDEWVTVANMIALRHVRARFISSVEENVRLGADLGASLTFSQ